MEEIVVTLTPWSLKRKKMLTFERYFVVSPSNARHCLCHFINHPLKLRCIYAHKYMAFSMLQSWCYFIYKVYRFIYWLFYWKIIIWCKWMIDVISVSPNNRKTKKKTKKVEKKKKVNNKLLSSIHCIFFIN